MGVGGAGIDAQVLHLPAAERSARNHALHRLLDQAFWVLAAENLPEGALLDAAGKAGVVAEDLVGQLVAGHLHLGGVDDDDVVAAVHVRRVGRLVLAAQAVGDDAGKTAENDAVGIDDIPLLGDLGGLGGVGLHAAGLVPWEARK